MVSVHGLLLCGWAVYELVRIPILTGGTTGDGSKGRKVRGVALWVVDESV